MEKDNFCERLRSERERLGYSQEDFGAIGGVKKLAQFKYEKGETSPTAAYLTAIGAVGADVVYILTGNRSVPTLLSPRAAALVDNFEHMADEDKRAIERLADAVQKPTAKTGTN